MNFVRNSKIQPSTVCAVMATSTALTFSSHDSETKQQSPQINKSWHHYSSILRTPSSKVFCDNSELLSASNTTPSSTSNLLNHPTTKKKRKKKKKKAEAIQAEPDIPEDEGPHLFRSQSFKPYQSMRKGILANMSSVQTFTTNGMEVGVCSAQNFRPYQEDSWIVLGDLIQKPKVNANDEDGHGDNRHWLSELLLKANNEEDKDDTTMDDKSTIENTSASTRDLAVFATFDGHGGDSCSKFATQNLRPIWERQLSETPNISEALERTLLEIDRLYLNNLGVDNVPTIDYNSPLPHYGQRVEPLKKKLTRTAGSTAITVAVDTATQTLVTSNVGDSRAILIHRYLNRTSAIPLSSDHSPASRPDEVERVEAAGGLVTGLARKATGKALTLIPTSCPRVYHGDTGVGGLNMTRSLGDVYLKPLVIANPETTVTPMVNGGNIAGRGKLVGCYLVLASDGVWDVLSNRETADLVLMLHDILLMNRDTDEDKVEESEKFSSATDLSLSEEVVRRSALLIAQTAQRRGSSDNITCMVVKLHPKESDEPTQPKSVFSRLSRL